MIPPASLPEFVLARARWRGDRAALVVMPRFDIAQYLDLDERCRATFLHVVPPVVLALPRSDRVLRDRERARLQDTMSSAAKPAVS